jgi:membrane protein DedA with SNARE-associated domain
MDSWVTSTVESMGYFGVALLMALENIFPPIPSELIMPLAGYVAARGDLSLWVVVAFGTVGAVAGTLPWYGVARWLDRDGVHRWVDRHGHWLTIDCDELERAERWFEKRGRLMVAIGRLIPGVRTIISVPAGYCAMPLGEYLAFSTIGTVVWTGALAYAGLALGQSYANVSRYLGPVTWVVLGVLVLIYLVRLVRMRKRNHARRTA